jgi:hypothetical protein
METIVVLLVVAAAAFWIARATINKRRSGACAGGCPSCGDGGAMKPRRLVSIRLSRPRSPGGGSDRSR